MLFQLLEGELTLFGSNFSPLFKTSKKGRHLSVACEMNRLRAVTHPTKLYISFGLRGDCISRRARIFSGFDSMPFWFTIKPRNFPDATPKAHLSGLSIIWYLRSTQSVRSRSWTWSAVSLDFTSILSTQTSMIFLICSLNIMISGTWHQLSLGQRA